MTFESQEGFSVARRIGGSPRMSSGENPGNNSFMKNFAAGVSLAASGADLAWEVRDQMSPQSIAPSNRSSVDPGYPTTWSPVDSVMKFFDVPINLRNDVGTLAAAANRCIHFIDDEARSLSLEEKSNSSYEVSRSPLNPAKRAAQPGANDNSGVTFDKLRKSIADKLENGSYECMICLEAIPKSSPVVACKGCQVISHLSCIQHYLSTLLEEGNEPVCLSCRERLSPEVNYRCFCQKIINPIPVEGLIPHSCGAICGRKISSGQSCELFCHPGPCD